MFQRGAAAALLLCAPAFSLAAATPPALDSTDGHMRTFWSLLTNPDDAPAKALAKDAGANGGQRAGVAKDAGKAETAADHAPDPRFGAAGAGVIRPFVRCIGDLIGGVHAILTVSAHPADGPRDDQSKPAGYYYGPGKSWSEEEPEGPSPGGKRTRP